ncbi:MAG: ferrochelatase [Opitutaceae bacterium]|jgi:protoporphyrin/coproporphyrin ferrochelatase|nr:ferrochelatase [Opitutaceae bacterium]
MSRRAVLLVNLGSPASTSTKDVRTYLREFLNDERVLDINPALRWILLEGVILRSRPAKSAEAYAKVWTEEGSPLVVMSEKVSEKLKTSLGPDTPVYLAMRYGQPSISSIVSKIAADGIDEILLFPQYPHYAMSSWETVVVKVKEEVAAQKPAIKVTTVQPFYQDADYIEALHSVAAPYLEQEHDHLLFSYHGLPERHMRVADSSCAHCTIVPDCCTTASPAHATCYKAQCLATTRELVKRAGISSEKYSVAYQSRLTKEPWLTPSTDKELERLPTTAVKKLLVICPAFTTDCLETLEEIQMEGCESFLEAGGTSFQQIPCLNDHPAFIDFLAKRVNLWLASNP